MIELTQHEKTAMYMYAVIKDMRGDFQAGTPDELAEFATNMLNTVIHLGNLAEKLGVEVPTIEEEDKDGTVVPDQTSA